MKRKHCWIEDVTERQSLELIEIVKKAAVLNNNCINNNIMYKNTIWYKSLLSVEKSCIQEGTLKKIHYKFEDGKEMVEEYNMDTKVLLRRAWKVKCKIGGEGKWDVEVGDPIVDAVNNTDIVEIKECKDQPFLTRRNTRINLEWRIRNLPYPTETYLINTDEKDKCIVVRTTNKKYFKRLQVPELHRLALPISQNNISYSHQFNTLIIVYKKPQQLLDMEKCLYEELNKVKPIKDIPNECRNQ